MREPVLVVGASGKIGRVIARRLANIGRDLILQCNRNCDVLKEVEESSLKSKPT